MKLRFVFSIQIVTTCSYFHFNNYDKHAAFVSFNSRIPLKGHFLLELWQKLSVHFRLSSRNLSLLSIQVTVFYLCSTRNLASFYLLGFEPSTQWFNELYA
jgi:hypothetical protein